MYLKISMVLMLLIGMNDTNAQLSFTGGQLLGVFDNDIALADFNDIATGDIDKDIDIDGKLILSKTFQNTPSATIDLSDNPAGIYFTNVIADGTNCNKKILKE